jgi:glycosyltransferase involved in cell wall biosynthesis
MIKIAYDHQTFTLQKYGGISRIFSEISSLINKSKDFDVEIYAGLYQNMYLSQRSGVSIRGKQIPYPPKTLKFFNKINTTFCKTLLALDRPDIVHETYYGMSRCAPKSSRIVITVHDMIHEKFINNKESKDFSKIKSIAINRADHIICVSENTKNDLLEMLNVLPEKISTIYLGRSINTNCTESEALITDPYLLYVGERVPEYKNFERLLSAYGASKLLQKEFKLVCFGPKPFSKQELEIINNIGINLNNILYYSGGDLILENLYAHAQALVYPSLYEGFGIPPLEAMSLSCPVICSRVSSIPEVVGDAGEYFDPYSIDSIVQSIEKVVFSSTHKHTLISKGCERAELFTWDKCAKETEQVYRNLLSNK